METESTFEVGRRTLIKDDGQELIVIYSVITDRLSNPVTGYEIFIYGVEVSAPAAREASKTRGVTVSGDRIFALADILVRGGVTPCSAPDVIEDWIRL